jgi:hypothetical protein
MDMQGYDVEPWDEIEDENDAALNDIKKAKSVTNSIRQGITKQGQYERNRWILEIDHKQKQAERKPMNKAQFAQREYAMSVRRFNQRNTRKTKKAREVQVKSI